MTTATDNVESAKAILGSASETERQFEDKPIESSNSAWRKLENPGDSFMGMFVGFDEEPDKFNPGKQRTVATWKELDSDVEFKTSCPTDLAALVRKLQNGHAYRVVFTGTARTGKGYSVKKFAAYAMKAPF